MGGQVPSDEPLTQKNKNKTQTYRQVETGGQLLLVFYSLDVGLPLPLHCCFLFFQTWISGDFQIATSPKATYPGYNGQHCASLIMSVVRVPAEAEEEP